MLAYTTYSEAGGVAKTTTAANLAVAHARAGLDVLVVPLDPQDADLSHLFGVDENRADSDADNLVRHMINRPKGPFEELIVEAEHGVDVIPEHNMLSELGTYLRREKQQSEDMGEAFGMYSQLRRIFREAGVNKSYDVLICDPPATEGPHLYNAIDATRTLVIPIRPSPKGETSVEGLSSVVEGLEDHLGAEIGVVAAVPNAYKGTNSQNRVLEEIEYPVPEVIRERSSLIEGCWEQQCSAYTYITDYRERTREYELETLAKFDRLARYIEEAAEIKAPNPPEPGSLDDETEVTV